MHSIISHVYLYRNLHLHADVVLQHGTEGGVSGETMTGVTGSSLELELIVKYFT